MNGAAVSKTRNIRRVGVPATIKGEPNPDYARSIGPTAERLKAAGDDFVKGGEERGGNPTYAMRDTPLDRAHKKKIISGAEHSALQKYRHHWFHAGQAPTIGSIDLNRIFAGGDSGPAGMPRSEGQVFHRQRWREAQSCLGLRSAAVVDRFVCSEENLEQCGQMLGWTSKPQAIAGASEIIRDAGYRLAKLWGIG